jgi:hypothetical protein
MDAATGIGLFQRSHCRCAHERVPECCGAKYVRGSTPWDYPFPDCIPPELSLRCGAAIKVRNGERRGAARGRSRRKRTEPRNPLRRPLPSQNSPSLCDDRRTAARLLGGPIAGRGTRLRGPIRCGVPAPRPADLVQCEPADDFLAPSSDATS